MENPIFLSAEPVGEADLDAFESEIGLELPAEYRAWLLAHNGGVPRRNRFRHRHRAGQGRETWVRRLYPLGRGNVNEEDTGDLRSAHRDRHRGLPAGLLPVGEAYFIGNTGRVCLECKGDRVGRVVFRPDVDPTSAVVYPAAGSWTEFLEGMDYEHGRPLPWKIAIEDRDPAALRAVLEESRAWRQHLGEATTIVRAALAFDDWPSVAVLLDLGFDPDDLFDEAMTSDRIDLARRILATGKVAEEAVAPALARGGAPLYRRLDVMAELRAAGADVDAPSPDRDRPLHRAVAARSEPAVRWLLEHGADPMARDGSRRTPRAVAEQLGEAGLAAILEEAERARDEVRRRNPKPDVVPFDLVGVRLSDPGPPLTFEEIRAFEDSIGVELTPEYRWLLLQANGSIPSPSAMPLDVGGDRTEEDGEDDDGGEGGWGEPTLAALFRLRDADSGPVVHLETFFTTVEELADGYGDRFEMPTGMVGIGSIHGYGMEGYGILLLACEGKDAGRLFAAEFDVEPLGLTLPELFAAMGAVTARPPTPDASLMEAIRGRDLDGVRAALAAGARPLNVSPGGDGPLPLACETGFDEAVVAMAKAGANVARLREFATMQGRTALLRRLLDIGKKPSKRALTDLLGDSDVFLDIDLVRELVARGADLKAEPHGIPTALMAAARSGSIEALELMFEAGYSPHRADRNFGSLLHAAASTDAPGAASVLRHLLGLGVRPNQTDAQGQTALHRAVMAGNLEAAKVLIDAGEDLHARHPIRLPGGGPADPSRMLGMLQGLLDRTDASPPPDPGTPLGAELAQVQGLLDQKLQGLSGVIRDRIEAISSGDWGKAASAAEFARGNPRLQSLLDELEAYAAREGS